MLAVAVVIGLVAAASVAFYVYMNSNDARLARLVTQAFNGNFRGTLLLRGARWEFPLGVRLEGVQIAPPDATPQLTVESAHVRLDVMPLLHHRIAVADLTLAAVHVDLIDSGSGSFRLAEAFTPIEPTAEPAHEEPSPSAWRVVLAHVQLHDGSTRIATPAWHLSINGLQLDDGNAALDSETIQTSMQLGASRVEGQFGTSEVALTDLGIVLQDGVYNIAAPAVRLGRAQIDLPGAHLDLRGRVTGLTDAIPALGVEGSLRVDAGNPAVLALLPDALRTSLRPHGTANVSFLADGTLLALDAEADLAGDHLEVASASIGAIRLAAHYEPAQLTLHRLYARALGGVLACDGTLALAPTMGAHEIHLAVQDIDLRAALKPWLADVAFIPEHLTATVTATGDSITPLVSELQLSGAARGMDPRALPGVPDPLQFSAEASARGDAVHIKDLKLRGDGATVEGHGVVPLRANGPLDFTVELDHAEPARSLRRFKLPIGATHIRLRAAAAGTLEAPVARATLTIDALTAPHLPPTQVVVPATLQGGILRIAQARATTADGGVTVSAELGLLDKHGTPHRDPTLRLDIAADALGVEQFAPGVVRGVAHLAATLRGTVQAPKGRATARIDGLSVRGVAFRNAQLAVAADRGTVQLTQLAITPMLGGMVTGSGSFGVKTQAIDATLRLRDLPALLVEQLAATPLGLSGTLRADAHVDGKPDAPRLRVTLRGDALSLQRMALGDLAVDADSDGHLAHASIVLAGGAAVVHGNATAHLDTQQLEARLTADHLVIRNALLAANTELNMDGAVALDLRAQGAWARPQLSGTVSVKDWIYEDTKVGTGVATAQLRSTAAGAYAVDVDLGGLITGDAHVLLDPRVQVTAQARFAQLALETLVPALQHRGTRVTLTGRVAAQYDSAGPGTGLDATLDLAELVAQAAGKSLTLSHPAHLVLRDKTVDLGDLTFAGQPGNVSFHGHVGADLDCRARAKLDLGFIADLVPQLGQASGELALDVAVRGTAAAPQATGTLFVPKPVSLRLRNTLEEIHINRLALNLRPNALIVQDVAGSIEGGAFTVKGDIGLRGFVPTSYNVHFQGDALPMHTSELTMEANVVADLLGNGPLPKVKARIDVTRGRYLKKFALQDFNFVARNPNTDTPLAESAPWLRDLQLDVVMTSSSGVDVKVDAGIFAVQADLGTQLHITGSPLAPHIDGKIAADTGHIKFPKAEMTIDQAIIDFVPTAGGKVDAQVSLHAHGDVTPSASSASSTVQTYAVSVSLEGTLDKMALDLQSTQGLSRLEVLSLLTTGHVNLAELAQGSGGETNKLDAALAFAGAQVSGPLTHFAERELERMLNLRVQLGAEISQEMVRVTATKDVNRRLRIEGAYEHAIGDEQSSISTRAQLSLTDRILLEGGTAKGLTGTVNRNLDRSAQSSLELKLRLMGH